jgi:hypothetical protein
METYTRHRNIVFYMILHNMDQFNKYVECGALNAGTPRVYGFDIVLRIIIYDYLLNNNKLDDKIIALIENNVAKLDTHGGPIESILSYFSGKKLIYHANIARLIFKVSEVNPWPLIKLLKSSKHLPRIRRMYLKKQWALKIMLHLQ